MPRAPFKGAVAAVWMLAALLTRPEAAGAPAMPLEVAGMMVTAAGAWSALDRHGGRLTLHYDARTAPELSVRVVLQGSAELQFADEAVPRQLSQGDCLLISAGRRHRVVSTDPAPGCVWLALFWPPADAC